MKANIAATNLEIKIGLNGDERMEILTTQKKLNFMDKDKQTEY